MYYGKRGLRLGHGAGAAFRPGGGRGQQGGASGWAKAGIPGAKGCGVIIIVIIVNIIIIIAYYYYYIIIIIIILLLWLLYSIIIIIIIILLLLSL